MSDKTGIEWTDATWNPVTGCTQISSGCAHCYAKTVHDQRYEAWRSGKWDKAPKQYHTPFRTVNPHPDRLTIPLKWKTPRKIFVNSMSDLFHEDVPFEFIDKVFAVMALAPQHTFQVLTKRAQRMAQYFKNGHPLWDKALSSLPNQDELIIDYTHLDVARDCCDEYSTYAKNWPLPNVWLGVSVENQKAADTRIPWLLKSPAAVRFLSCEPLLGKVDLSGSTEENPIPYLYTGHAKIDWVICGGESGHSDKIRPMHPDWARSLRDQCQAASGASGASVPFFFKQWGEWLPSSQDRAVKYWGEKGYETQLFKLAGSTDMNAARVGKKAAGDLLDGKRWHEFPVIPALAVHS